MSDLETFVRLAALPPTAWLQVEAGFRAGLEAAAVLEHVQTSRDGLLRPQWRGMAAGVSPADVIRRARAARSEEHTSELQSH